MATVSTDSQLKEVAVRIREMREICGISEADMAQKTEVSAEEYRLYEEKRIFPSPLYINARSLSESALPTCLRDRAPTFPPTP